MKPTWLLCLALAVTGGCSVARVPVQTAAEPTGTQISQIHMLDARNGWGWVTGIAGIQSLLRTSNGGRTWMDVTPKGFPYTGEGSCFYDSEIAWLSFSDRKSATGGLLHTTDGGRSWSLLNRTNTPVFTESGDARFFDAVYGITETCDGGLGSSYINFFETHDSGKTWQIVPMTPRHPEGGNSSYTFHLCSLCMDRMVFYPPATIVIASGDMGDEQPKGAVRLSVSNDSGKSWRDLTLPLPDQYRDGLSEPLEPVFFDAKKAVIASHIVKFNADDSHVYDGLVFYSTEDGGKTWLLKPGLITFKAGVSPSDFDVVSAHDIFLRGDANLYVTHNGAHSWQVLKPNIEFGEESKRDVLQVDFVDATHGWMIISDNRHFYPSGHFILYKTSDGGKTWAELPLRIER